MNPRAINYVQSDLLYFPIMIYVLIFFAAYFGMEAVAWFSHKYIMHGIGWVFHKDHHRSKPGFFERNDVFFLLFSVPSAICIYLGVSTEITSLIFIGAGITAYGATYFIIHDLFIHQRIKIWRNTDSEYLRAIRKAHKMHHKHQDKEGGECFGLLWVPTKYIKEALR